MDNTIGIYGNGSTSNDSFYMTLPSTASHKLYTKNTSSNYITKFPNPLTLNGNWEVGLTEIHLPCQWHNITSQNNTFDTTYRRKDIVIAKCDIPVNLNYVLFIDMDFEEGETIERKNYYLMLKNKIASSYGLKPQYGDGDESRIFFDDVEIMFSNDLDDDNYIRRRVTFVCHNGWSVIYDTHSPYISNKVDVLGKLTGFHESTLRYNLNDRSVYLDDESNIFDKNIPAINHKVMLVCPLVSVQKREKRGTPYAPLFKDYFISQGIAEKELPHIVDSLSHTVLEPSLYLSKNDLKSKLKIPPPVTFDSVPAVTLHPIDTIDASLSNVDNDNDNDDDGESAKKRAVSATINVHARVKRYVPTNQAIQVFTGLFRRGKYIVDPHGILDSKTSVVRVDLDVIEYVTFHHKCRISTGFYKTRQDLVDALNNSISQYAGTNLKLVLQGLYLTVESFNLTQYSIKFSKKDNNLGQILGLDTKYLGVNLPPLEGEQNTFRFQSPVDITGGLSYMFVYCDIIRQQMVGDFKANVLRVINVSTKESMSVNFANSTYYQPMSSNFFGSIHIVIKADSGHDINFTSGKTVCVLHFRRSVK